MSDALAGVIVGGLLGVLGAVLGQALAGWHARKLAEAERSERREAELLAARRSAYVDIGKVVTTIRLYAKRGHAMAAADEAGELEWRHVLAMTEVYASDELQAVMRLLVNTLAAADRGVRAATDVQVVATGVLTQIRHELSGILGWNTYVADIEADGMSVDDVLARAAQIVADEAEQAQGGDPAAT